VTFDYKQMQQHVLRLSTVVAKPVIPGFDAFLPSDAGNAITVVL